MHTPAYLCLRTRPRLPQQPPNNPKNPAYLCLRTPLPSLCLHTPLPSLCLHTPAYLCLRTRPRLPQQPPNNPKNPAYLCLHTRSGLATPLPSLPLRTPLPHYPTTPAHPRPCLGGCGGVKLVEAVGWGGRLSGCAGV